MSLQQSNAVISTFYGLTPKLVAADVNISAPTTKDMAQFGGLIRHVILLDPAYAGVATDLQIGDDVQILSFGPFAVDQTKRYRVFSVAPSGNFGLEVLRVVLGEKTNR